MRLPALDKKQTIVAILLVIVLIVLFWQVYTLFFTTPNAPEPHRAITTATQPKIVSHVPIATNTDQTANSSAVPVNSNDLANTPEQQKYLQLLEEYKIAELQKLIAQDKQVIAASQAATAESLSKINQLGVTTNMADFGFDNKSAVGNNTANSALTLVYTGLQDGQWTATLKRGNDTYDVMVGTVIDNSKVTHIDNNEVILQNPQHIIHIGFDGTTSVLAAKAANLAAERNPKALATTSTTTTAVNGPLAQTGNNNVQGIVQTPALPTAPIAPHTVASPSVTPSIQATKTTTTVAYPLTNMPNIPKSAPIIKPVPTEKPLHLIKPTPKPTSPQTQTVSHMPELFKDVNKIWHSAANWVNQKIHPKPRTNYFFESAPLPAAPVINKAAVVTPPAATTPGTQPMQAPKINLTSLTTTVQATTKSTPIQAVATSAPNGYTIQLAALATQEACDQFIQKTQLATNYKNQYHIYEKKSLHHPRYIIVLGNYASHALAEQAYSKLPEEALSAGAYIRPMTAVQHDIDHA